MPNFGNEDFLEILLEAAKNHGQLSEPDHEVGDLQDMLHVAWKLMSPEQRHEAVLEIWPKVQGWV